MNENMNIDLGKILDQIFEATKSFGDAFKEGFKNKEYPGFDHDFRFKWDEKVDYYPAYSYPPANVYLTKDKSLVFEFALAGFGEKDIHLEFQGDYMVLYAKGPEEAERTDVRYFKRRLKLRDIYEQRYYAPEDKFDRKNVKAVFKNGILKVVIPPNEEIRTKDGIKIEIVKEDE
jgi:HSP20 family protein